MEVPILNVEVAMLVNTNTTQDFGERFVRKPSACRQFYRTTSENQSTYGSFEGSTAPEQR